MREKPDVVCLQELKCADESLPIADIEAAGYGAVWHGQKGFNGVAILARGDSPELRRVGLPGDPDDSTAAISRREVEGSSSARSICPTAIRSAPRSSTTSCAGWSGLRAHAAELLAEERPMSCAATGTSFRRTATSFRSARPQHDAVMQPERAQLWRRILHQGWTDALRALPPGRGEALHLLGLHRRLLAARPRLPPRPSAVLARSRGPVAGRRRRPLGARRGEGLRPRADLGRTR